MLFKHLSTLLLATLATAVPVTINSELEVRTPTDLNERGELTERGLFSRDDLVDGKCADIIVVFARGTIELGNVGSVIGPPLAVALSLNKKTTGRYIFQGVEYPASIPGFFAGGDKKGSEKMRDLVVQATKQCPGKKIVMSGYSQGAQLVHNALDMMDDATAASVKAVVMFGDPKENQPLPHSLGQNSLTICHDFDLICNNFPLPGPAHIDYALDARTAADFISQRC